jgi:hypothetical protein
MDPCLYFFEYLPDVFKKKTKVLDIFDADKNISMKIIIESSPSSRDMDKDPFLQQVRIPITGLNQRV